jgi:hypothetical protein
MTRRVYHKYVLIIALCIGLTGCASPGQQRPYVEPQYGVTKRQLLDLVGPPASMEIFQKPDKSRIEFYNYVKYYQSSEETIPICLINNKVVGWGKAFYEDHITTDDIRIK